MTNNIIWRKEFIFPTSSRAIVNKERLYDIGQDKLPSVTTILAATQSDEKKASLEAWRQRLGAEAADKVKDDAAARGTVLHHIIESWLTDQGHLDLTEVGQLAEKMARQIWSNCIESRLTEIWGIEPTVFHGGMGYAGAVDLICVHDGVPTVCDWKQKNKVIHSFQKHYIYDYGLQIAAYSLAFQDMSGENIHKGVNAMVTPKLEYMEFSYEGEEFKKLKYEWMKRVEQYYEMKEKNQLDKTK